MDRPILLRQPMVMTTRSLLALLLLLSACYRRTHEEDPCEAAARGTCTGTVGGIDVSGPLDPESGWLLPSGGTAPCGDDPLVMVVSCGGRAFRARAVYPHDDSEVAVCGWSTDAPSAAPALASAPLYPLPERDWRTRGTMVATFADGSHVDVNYDFADEVQCKGANERVMKGVNTGLRAAETTVEVISGVAWVVTLPFRIFGGGAGSASGRGHSSGGHHHSHHHH